MLIDTREKSIIDILIKKNIDISIEQLNLGDFHIIYDDHYELLIERKTIHDFWNSIIDNRLKEQRARLKEWSNDQHLFVIYMIEYDKEINEEQLNTIERCILRLNLIYKFMIVKVKNSEETCNYLIWLKNQKTFFKDIDLDKDKMESWCKQIIPKKKDIKTSENLIIVLLMSINGISYNIAKSLTLNCKSILDYIEELKKINIKDYSNIIINQKKLGLKKAQLIYSLLGLSQ